MVPLVVVRPAPTRRPARERGCESLESRLCLALTFGTPLTYPMSNGQFTSSDLALGDFNADLVVGFAGRSQPSSNPVGGLAVFLGSGGGFFAAPTVYGNVPASGTNTVAVGDFNNDGKDDLMNGIYRSGAGTYPVTHALRRGNGTGGFQSPNSTFGSGLRAPRYVVTDFNGDGIDDLAYTDIVSGDRPVLDIKTGITNSGFSTIRYPLPTTAAYLLGAGDFNGDGVVDLAVAASGSANVMIWIRTPAGGLAFPPPVPLPANVQSLAVVDANGDGRKDLLVAMVNNQLAVLPGKGDGGFDTHLTPASSAGPVDRFTTGDFDGDGKLDVAVANWISHTVDVFAGSGAGTFAPPVTFAVPTNSAPTSIVAGDYNKDGRLDLAVASRSNAALTVLLNTSPPADATPPTAQLVTAPLTVAGRFFPPVDVIYSDNVAVNRSSVGSGDVVVTGPNGYNQTSHIFSTTLVGGSQVRARYSVNGPASGFTNAAANGTYTVTLKPNRIKDATGNFVPGGVIGTFQVNVPPDNVPPTTTLASAQNVTIGGGSAYRFSVVHTDNVGVLAHGQNVGGPVGVTGPNGQSLAGAYLYRVFPPDGSPLAYDYVVQAPGGAWDPADNGTYTLSLLPDALFDTSGNAGVPKALGTFQVNVPAGTGSITATVYDDANANGVQDAGEGPLVFRQVYLDVNNNGLPDGGDPIKFTSSSGAATFANLPAGNYVLRAIPAVSVLAGERQTDPASGAGHTIPLAQGAAASRALGITGLPGVVRAEFAHQATPHALKIVFNRNVSDTLGVEDLAVVNLATGLPVFPDEYRYDPITDNKIIEETATFTFDGVLPDGNYRAILSAAGITDASGTGISGATTFDFFVLAGDANHDRTVNFADLLALAKNYNGTGKTYAQGDFNYDGIVNFADLLTLAKSYNKSLPAPPPATAPATATATADLRSASSRSNFSTTPAPRPVPVQPKPSPLKRR
jgi:hypothetical protein